MKLNTQSPLVVLCLFFTIITLFSCSKDSDLMADYVALDPEIGTIARFVANDTYQISISNNEENETFDIIVNSGSTGTDNGESNGTTVNDSYQTSTTASIVLDVLANDTFEKKEEILISETSQPAYGDVVINADNTLTYTPTVVEATEDTFTYTAEFVEEDGKISAETGTVTVNINQDIINMGVLKAFPGAEGFGKNTVGGRGGLVYHVTNLNDSGTGSFRYGVESLSSKRTIVFDVSGYINLSTPIKIRDGYGNITIAGETSPEGIALRGSGIWIHDGEVIIRYIKIRPGEDAYVPPSSGDYEPDDGIRIQAYSGDPFENIIIDHVTVTWAHDGLIDVSSASSAYIRNVTIQNSLMAENVDKQYGMLAFNTYNITYYNNILAFTSDRNIAISPPEGKGVEMVNNFVYCTDRSTWYREGNVNDFIGNVFVTGNRTRQYETFKMEEAYPTDTDPNAASIYIKDNLDDGVNVDSNYNSRAVNHIASSPNYNTGLPVISSNLVENALVDKVGDVLHYDAADTRIMNNIKNRSGNLIADEADVGGYPTLGTSVRSDGYDTDNDGMEDSWEIAEYGDLNTNNNDDTDGNGYTNLEAFLHWLTLQN